ncbi:MAG: hypothetical protein RL385_4880 [Pseudomonadota bacterium]
MVLDHERLDVYQLSLDFMAFGNGVIEGLPRGRSHLADQLTRASLSIVLNIAEGAGKHSKQDTKPARRCSCAWSRCSSSLRRAWKSESDLA